MHITEELRVMRAARNGLATLLLFAAEILTIAIAAPPQTAGSFARLDPAFDALVPKNAQVEKLAGGFTFIEGPLWRPQGALWFSDVVGNVVRQWSSDGTVTEILRPGGYDGTSLPAGGFVGPKRDGG